MSLSKREAVTIHLRHVRNELREIHICLEKEKLLPEPGEIKALLSQMEALLGPSQILQKQKKHKFFAKEALKTLNQ